MTRKLRLGVNIDHVATVRNARGGRFPDPCRAAGIAAEAGADGVTAHLREDRRHVSDGDIERLSRELRLPLNLEMAMTGEMQRIALAAMPNAVCIVPERRAELTTEGGLDVAANEDALRAFVAPIAELGVRISLFVAPDPRQVDAAARAGADIVELHAGAYCEAHERGERALREAELGRIAEMAGRAAAAGLEVHAGHGLGYETVAPVAAIPEIVELNIGHFLVGEAIFVGLGPAVREMRRRMDLARRGEAAS